VVFGVVAGSVLPFVEQTFDALGEERVVVGAALAAWLARAVAVRTPRAAGAPALIVAWGRRPVSGKLSAIPGGWALPALDPLRPQLTVAAIVTVVPVVVALVALHANLTAATYLRSAGWDPPRRAIEVATGLVVVGSCFGPCRSAWAPRDAPDRRPEAGERPMRVWSVHTSGAAFAGIGLLGGMAAGIPTALPSPLLAMAGLAWSRARPGPPEITRGPLRLGRCWPSR
jgi:predicted benzoate:H+ symporter BenE